MTDQLAVQMNSIEKCHSSLKLASSRIAIQPDKLPRRGLCMRLRFTNPAEAETIIRELNPPIQEFLKLLQKSETDTLCGNQHRMAQFALIKYGNQVAA